MDKKYGIAFTKVTGAGNDFIVLDDKAGEMAAHDLDYSRIAQDLCRRKLSVGADGLLVLEDSDKADFRMRIINPDGSEVDMCGNGARCSAYYAAVNGWGNNLTIETGAGIINADVSGSEVKLKMSDPKDIKLGINLGIGPNMLIAHFLNTGVPHVVHLVDSLEGYDVENVGRQIRQHSMFAPDGTNANFVGEIKGQAASIRTYERGVEAETLACGTGTVASAVVLGLLGHVKSPVRMMTKSGEVLTVHFEVSGKEVKNVYLEGQAHIVFEGKA